MKNAQTVFALLAVCALSACGGGGSSSSTVPSGSSSGATIQTHVRTPSGDKKVASGSYSLFGDATLVHPGDASPTAVQEVWSPSVPPGYGGIDFGIPAGLTVGQLNVLSTDFRLTQGFCSQGSPRFAIGVPGGEVWAYLGPQFPQPPTNPCPVGVYANSTNVIDATHVVDATQVGGGYVPWPVYQALHSNDPVSYIQLVVDGFTTPNITAQFDNTNVNGQLYTYESSGSCKDGGWQMFTGSPGPFKNQGDCVSYFNNGK